MKLPPTFCALLLPSALWLAPGVTASDWNQWRGPLRNGVLPESVPLLDAIPSSGLQELWDSENIPSNDDGGLGSVVVANGKVYLSVVWQSDVPSETRTINDLVMRQLGYQSTGGLGKELVTKMEATRESLPPTLRGKKLDEFADQWIEENLERKQKMLFKGFISSRFKKGPLAIPLADLDALQAMVDKPFPTESAFKKWVESQTFADFVKQAVLEAVPPTKRVAEDTVICLDLATGKLLWKTSAPGEPKGRFCSSTPAVMDGKVYALGSTRAYCMDAATGKQLWSAPLPAKAPGASPLVAEGALVANAGRLAAWDASNGKKLWEQQKVGGGNGSPVLWRSGGKTFVICNGRDLSAVDLATGAIAWSVPAGGDSTPAIVDDNLAVQSKSSSIGLVVYRLAAAGAQKLWNHPIDAVRTQSSPIIYEGRVFLMDDNVHYCWDLATGKLAWQAPVQATISSPALADGKIFVLINNGNNLQVLKAAGAERVELGKANVRAQWVPSPTIAEGKLLLRMKDKVRCFDLTAGSGATASK